MGMRTWLTVLYATLSQSKFADANIAVLHCGYYRVGDVKVGQHRRESNSLLLIADGDLYCKGRSNFDSVSCEAHQSALEVSKRLKIALLRAEAGSRRNTA